MAKVRGRCKVSYIAIDTETTGLDFKRGVKPFAISLCDGNNSYCFEGKVDPFTRDVFWEKKDLDKVRKLLKDHDKIVMHNAVFDVKSLAAIGIDLTSEWDRIEDTMLASHALDSRESHRLKPLAKKYLNINDDDKKALVDAIHRARNSARSVNKEQDEKGFSPIFTLGEEVMYDSWLPKLIFPKEKSLETYATLDAERTILLWLKVFAPQLVKDGLLSQYKKNMRILPVVHRLEDYGVTVHPKTIKSELKRIGQIRDRAVQEAYAIIPPTICTNLNSGQQLARALHEYLKLPVLFTTPKGAPATDAETLKALQAATNKRSKAYKFLQNVRKAAQAETAITYLTNYDRHKTKWNGIYCLFPSLNPTGTATLRFSGSNPNPQNVGKGKEVDEDTKEVDYKLRTVFGPQPGRIWYAIDYDQLQLRIFAKASGEERMVKAFDDGYDFHTWMGCEIFQVAPDQLTKLQRRIAKNVNFGYIFGAGPRKIEETSGVKGLSDKLAKMFPVVTDFMKKTIAEVKSRGFIYTLGGYRLTIDKAKAYSSVCIIVQGTEGEIVKEAMVSVDQYIAPMKTDFFMTLQVHDELVFDASLKQEKKHLSILREIKSRMEAASLTVGVKTVANCEVNRKNWAAFEKVKL